MPEIRTEQPLSLETFNRGPSAALFAPWRHQGFSTGTDPYILVVNVSEREQCRVEGVLGDSRYCLHIPLPYELAEGELRWSAYLPSLALPAYGDTPEEVLEDLQYAIIEYHEFLSRQDDETLGKIPKRHKRILTGILEEI